MTSERKATDQRCDEQARIEQHASVPLGRVRVGEVRWEEFLYEPRPALRAVACGGRPRPAGPTSGDQTPTSKPRSTSLAGVPPRMPQFSRATSFRTMSRSDGGIPWRPRFLTTAR
jgi:hypothetical protein